MTRRRRAAARMSDARLNISLGPELLQRLQQRADELGYTTSMVAREAIHDGLEPAIRRLREEENG